MIAGIKLLSGNKIGDKIYVAGQISFLNRSIPVSYEFEERVDGLYWIAQTITLFEKSKYEKTKREEKNEKCTDETKKQVYAVLNHEQPEYNEVIDNGKNKKLYF